MEEKTFTEEALEKVILTVEEEYEMASKEGLLRELRTSLEEAKKLKTYDDLLINYSQFLKKQLDQMKEVIEIDDTDEEGTGDLWIHYAQIWQNNGIDPELSNWFNDAFGNGTSNRGGGVLR